MAKSLMKVHPLPAALTLVCTATGAVVLIGITVLAAIPFVIGLGLLLGWVVVSLLLGWAAIEALAAIERWMEKDPRFSR